MDPRKTVDIERRRHEASVSDGISEETEKLGKVSSPRERSGRCVNYIRSVLMQFVFLRVRCGARLRSTDPSTFFRSRAGFGRHDDVAVFRVEQCCGTEML